MLPIETVKHKFKCFNKKRTIVDEEKGDIQEKSLEKLEGIRKRRGFLSSCFCAFIFTYYTISTLQLTQYFTYIGSNEISRDKNYISALEERFLNALQLNLASNWSQVYTAVPHLAGKGIELVEFTAEKFKEYKLETHIEAFDVYLNYPVDAKLTLLDQFDNIEFEASLQEDVLKEDPTTGGNDTVPIFHGYSASGNVSAEYVYVNYGRKSDFELLKSKKVNLEGKIAIARYGEIFRGLKVKFAEQAGCTGVLLYSDPADDRYSEDDGYLVYPDGPVRNPSSVQRGSVEFLSDMPGDPTTPGYPSQGNVERKEPTTIPKIPSLPVSLNDIEPILKRLNGYGIDLTQDEDFSGWVGGSKQFQYFTGPTEDYKVNIYNEQSYDIREIHNVYGKIPGKSKDFILIGNHRDAWIKGGASDPNSGSSTMLEIIRGLHELSKTGWKPEKTLIFASWDGEEYGLLGSTEFGEKYDKLLKKNCIAYLNLDVSVGGSQLGLSASPILNRLLINSLSKVHYPGDNTDNTSLFDHFFKDTESSIGILGSGSDYTVFLEHLGIPSADIGFVEGKNDGVYNYHSNYDSYYWMSTILDPGFKYHQAIAKYLGLTILNISEKNVLNFELNTYAKELNKYFTDLMKRVPKDWLSKEMVCTYATEHKFPLRTIKSYIEELENDLNRLDYRSKKFDKYCDSLEKSWENSNDLPFYKRIILKLKIRRVNFPLKMFERNFLTEDGLKGRPWYKHLVFAAGRDTGYEGFALPGIKESLDDLDSTDFIYWLRKLHHAIRRINVSLEL
ncbi:hypothetical protein TBLA_0A04020 [Henningerozyma blattae CBS 6284]|uniref:Uncharacterized protein n=1 Tax=Henningerozyma blattae (strain ATCC 34711 / CBS 6284 / DSM 70876 / NBRC 10599 / NRRL Y-10934 / UCD 77-7) TaxID=1071380 RepID=I2GVP6_HENB6|nr:hypothetical protein TBLA_0A04020 [Tetrapisispora blattae CBS 6284]CCH58198.1 hypothetical protein TBLA_0A04020 [Tetrapisispora blattae CBS 6284]